MSSYFVKSLSACYGSGPAGLDPCSENISGYDRNPSHHHHHHHQQQQHISNNLYSQAVYGNPRYSSFHHAALNTETRYGETIHSEYYSVPRLTHLPPSSPSPPPIQANISCTPVSSSPSTSPQLCDKKHASSFCGGTEYQNNSSSTASSLSGTSALHNAPANNGAPNISNQSHSGSNGGVSTGDSGFYPTTGVNFLDSNKSCDSPPLGQRQKLPQPAHQQPSAPSSPPSPPSKQQQQQQRQNGKSCSPNPQSDQAESSFPAPQIYPWMRRMQYSAGM